MEGIYLDYNGSAPLDPRVAEVMGRALREGLGNASSAHRFGRRQAAAVDAARERVAALVGGRPSGVVFTAGATEANNLALGERSRADLPTGAGSWSRRSSTLPFPAPRRGSRNRGWPRWRSFR